MLLLTLTHMAPRSVFVITNQAVYGVLHYTHRNPYSIASNNQWAYTLNVSNTLFSAIYWWQTAVFGTSTQCWMVTIAVALGSNETQTAIGQSTGQLWTPFVRFCISIKIVYMWNNSLSPRTNTNSCRSHVSVAGSIQFHLISFATSHRHPSCSFPLFLSISSCVLLFFVCKSFCFVVSSQRHGMFMPNLKFYFIWRYF